MYTDGAILSRVSQDPTQGNDMTYNAVDETSRVDGSRWGGIRAYWVAEAAAPTSSKGKFRQVNLKLKDVAALCYATNDMLQDASALGSWLGRTVPGELRFAAEDAIFEGNGAGKPLGIMNSPALVSVTRTDANKVQYADVLNMWARRYAALNDYVWLVNQDIMPQLLQLGTTYQLVYLPPGGLSASPYGSLLGRPVIEVEYAATLGTTGDIMLASLSQYQTITKGGIQAESSIHVAFTTFDTAFRFMYRLDGAPLWHSALTPFKGSNTQSPFVVLTTAS
jgi:HK97 family phage major capsid protein